MKRLLLLAFALFTATLPVLAQDDDEMEAPSASVKGDGKPRPTIDLNSYLLENIRPPARKSAKSPAEARLTVKFMVDEFGDVKDVKVTKPSGYKELDDEVVSIVEGTPKWNPAMRNGKPTKMYYTLPVKVLLEAAEEDENDAAAQKADRTRERKEKKQEDNEEREERNQERREKKEKPAKEDDEDE
ncbi:MAG: TonB family protein [Flavipsychrobacter sp.]|nr:TonB family protein [Flavipsychrobacter sp.]